MDGATSIRRLKKFCLALSRTDARDFQRAGRRHDIDSTRLVE
jgi:hypothetical protein